MRDPHQTFFFYDLETSGLSPRDDRIMQFAGQRVSLDLEPMGEPVNLLVKMTDDTLPSPGAVMVTGITPQSTLADGLTEAELCDYLVHEVFTPGTIAVGYNNVHFDDEFIRHLFWRNFYDAYEWQWKDGRSRWDLIDVVRMVRALRPEGIVWPTNPDGSDSNRLEHLTKENGLAHQHAHDALSDVEATIQVAQLLREKQPQMFEFLLRLRDKRAVSQLVNPQAPQAFVYTAGRNAAEFAKTTVAYPLADLGQSKVLLFDLRYNLDEFLAGKDDAAESVADADAEKERPRFAPLIKMLAVNRCPAVAPVGVLEKMDGWQRIGLTKAQLEKNRQSLLAHPEFVREAVAEYSREGRQFAAPVDAESALYDGFLGNQDAEKCGLVRGANAQQLQGFHPEFQDRRLKELFLHYRARNFAQTLEEGEVQAWEKYRRERLNRQAPKFTAEITEIQQKLATEPDDNKAFLVEELLLWYQSLASADFDD